MLVSIGECKWSETVTPAHVARLDQVRSRLGAAGIDVSKNTLAFYTGQRRGAGKRAAMPAGLRQVDLAEIFGAPSEAG